MSTRAGIFRSGFDARICQQHLHSPILQELQNDSGGEASSDGGSPTAGAAEVVDIQADSKAARVSGSGGGLTKRISGRFSQEAFDAKEQELSFLQQRCMQFEV